MSAPVDVLAVLDTLCERAASGDPAEYREVNSLRDAVTELIEAANRAAIAAVRGDDNRPGSIRNTDLDGLRAALARVKGGAV